MECEICGREDAQETHFGCKSVRMCQTCRDFSTNVEELKSGGADEKTKEEIVTLLKEKLAELEREINEIDSHILATLARAEGESGMVGVDVPIDALVAATGRDKDVVQVGIDRLRVRRLVEVRGQGLITLTALGKRFTG